MDKCSQAKLKPLTLLLEDVKECVKEFNKVRTVDEERTLLRLTDARTTGERCEQGEARHAGS